MEILMEAKSNYVKKYKCIYCGQHYDRANLIKHIEKYHEDEIPENYSATRVVFDIINKKDHGNCVICQKVTNWNPNLARYDRFCSEECKKKYTEEAKARMIRVYGKEHLLDDPEQQKKMIGNRGISGTYKMSSGGTLSYTGTYEKKALEFMDRVLEYKVTDIETPGPVIEYMYNGKKHFWITDIYIPAYELCIDVKDGGDNPNKRDMKEYREKQIAKEKAIAKQGKYNYLRLTNNNFTQLLSTLAELKMQLIDHNPDKIIRINENMFAAIGAMMPMEKDRQKDVYICNYTLNNIFANTCVSDDPYFENAFVITADGLLREAPIQNIIGSERVKYNIYRATVEDTDIFNKLHRLSVDKVVNDKSLLEIVFDNEMYSDDEWTCYENVTEIDDIYTYLYEVNRITKASLLPQKKSFIPFSESLYDYDSKNIVVKEDVNGYFIENTITGMRSPSRSKNEFNDIELKIVAGGTF